MPEKSSSEHFLLGPLSLRNSQLSQDWKSLDCKTYRTFLDCTVTKNFQFAQIITEKPLLTSLIVNILLKISVFQWLSMVTGNYKLVRKA